MHQESSVDAGYYGRYVVCNLLLKWKHTGRVRVRACVCSRVQV